MKENNQPQKVLTSEQTNLVSELTSTYGIEPEDILFFGNDPKPFLTYEATCVLCNSLTMLNSIDIESVNSNFRDSYVFRCTLLTNDGRTRSAVGVVNANEVVDGKPLSEQQITQLGSSRAIRNALKTAGIDLMRLHNEAIKGDSSNLPFKSSYASLLGQAHALGSEAQLIQGDNKAAWYAILQNRYGVSSSNQLNEEQLADFVAFLKTFVPSQKIAA
ncbi:MAG TPA: hypothetical protein PKY59_16990 [Pyrinomonadaceae bacterium]|nr:hypothetical protein [Pyrinomonadaceae bacterium]